MKRFTIISSLILFFALSVAAQGFTSYKLDNGLSVFLWEDHNQPTVYGSVIVRAGSIDEPAEYTGLAHYLEHVLFKGTEKIGALNWEAEKPHYEKIIKLYDDYALATDPKVRAELEKQINDESIEAGKYTSTNEFSNLVQSIGGTGLNAGTNYDLTYYYNSFPAFQLEKWLDLYSERLINPVFRSFQAELENVFEEYNMGQDNNMEHTRNFLFEHIYAGHPYSRDVIGTPEHLKNPRLSRLIEFFNTWYVPNNMALVLVGNFDSQKAMPIIEAKFSRLKAKELPARPSYPETDFSKNQRFTAKLGYFPTVFWAYKAVDIANEETYLLDFCANLLSNSMNTGLLDKITMDGDVQSAAAVFDNRRERGRFLIQAVPYYDVAQRRYESDRATEKIVMQQIDKLKNGEVEDWLIESVKKSMLREAILQLEGISGKFSILLGIYAYQLPNDYFTSHIAKIRKVTQADIQRTAQKYLDANRITVSIEAGTPKKNKLKKPQIKPVVQPESEKSAYANAFKKIPAQEVELTFNNFTDVKSVDLDTDIHLHHTKNPLNNYFSLTLRYGIGTEKMPKLKYAVALMNSAGIMPDIDAQTVRREFSQLDATCNFGVNGSYLYVQIIGNEEKLEEICKLMTRLTILPKLDDKQRDRVVGGEISTRLSIEQKDADVLGNALFEYALYKEKSDYIDRMKLIDVYNLKISELTGEFQRATNYELDIHYVGKKEFDEVQVLLNKNLPLKQGVKHSESPIVKDRVTYDKPTIYFLANNDAQQAQIYFYIEGEPYKIENAVAYNAFQEYFGGGFNGLVMQEIREKNSMAYATAGGFRTPPVQNKKSFFLGYIGSQSDKAADAIDAFVKLLKDMPQYPERIGDIKTYLKQAYLAQKPSFRSKSQVFAEWQKLGYTDDPAKANMQKIENLTFDDIVKFYNEKVKGKPLTIVIMGDSKLVNLKQIEAAHGKITKISASRLFTLGLD